MSTHTEDTKEMTVEKLVSTIKILAMKAGSYGRSWREFEKIVTHALNTYASQVREKRDREIVAYCDEQIAHEIGLGGKNGNKQVIETYEYVKEFIKL